jgi:hypothetical protein
MRLNSGSSFHSVRNDGVFPPSKVSSAFLRDSVVKNIAFIKNVDYPKFKTLSA